MSENSPNRLIEDFLGSVRIFSSSVDDLLQAQLSEVAEDGFTISQVKLLSLVAVTDGHMISDVAAYLGVSNAAASKAVDRLVRRGLLRREEAEADRRAVELSVTDQGQRLLERYQVAMERVLTGLFSGLKPDELEDTARLLDRLSVGIIDLDGGQDGICFRCGMHFRERCLLRQARSRDCFFHLHKRRSQKTK